MRLSRFIKQIEDFFSGKKSKGLAFRLEQRLVGDDVMSSNVMFEGDHVSESIDEALSASENRRSKKGKSGGGKEDVMRFLQDVLSAGPVNVLEVERQARAAALLEDDKRLNKSKAFRDARECPRCDVVAGRIWSRLPVRLGAARYAIGAHWRYRRPLPNRDANGRFGRQWRFGGAAMPGPALRPSSPGGETN